MGAGKRLTYYIQKQGFNKKDFCEKYNVEYNGFVMILADKRSLGIKILNQVHEAFPFLNVHWVLYGVGPEEFMESNILSDTMEMYASKDDAFEFMLLKYLDNEKVKNKIYEITTKEK